MDLPPLDPDLYRKLREDIRFRGIQVPILVDSVTGEVIDGRQRKQIAAELKIKAIPTIHVGRLTEGERADLRLAVNLYRRHLSRVQMREMIAWALRQRPESSDRSLADGCGVDHKTVGGVRRRLESTGEIPQFDARRGANGKRYPAAKPTVYSASTVEGRRATSLLNQLGEDAPPGPDSLQGLHKRLALKEREALEGGPEASLPAWIKIERCDFRDLAVPDGSVDLIFTDPIWGDEDRALMPEFASWAARKLNPDGGILLLYTGHAGLLEVGGEIAKKLNYLWTISCVNGPNNGRSTRHALMIRVCWRPVLMFCRGKYRPDRVGRVFDDVVISETSEKSHHRFQQPLGEALFYVKSLTGPKAVVCDPFLGSGTTGCAVARLGQGRRFWGSEVDTETCSIARRRVAEELKSPGATVSMAKAVPVR